jgi:hypothetical protein
MSQTRSSVMRLALQLWDAETGELIWSSLAEATMQKEGVSQDPVYLQDIARVTLGMYSIGSHEPTHVLPVHARQSIP